LIEKKQLELYCGLFLGYVLKEAAVKSTQHVEEKQLRAHREERDKRLDPSTQSVIIMMREKSDVRLHE